MTGALAFAVLGDPIAQSKSPGMHQAAYRALGLPHTYDKHRVTAPELPAWVAALRQGKYAGFNVTIPHKQAVLGLSDQVTPLARAIDAANTLVRAHDGAVTAHNTDVPAIGAELLRLSQGAPVSTRGAAALVLGSGGAARAAVAAVLELGFDEVRVRARAFADESRAGAFRDALGSLPGASAIVTEALGPSPADARVACVVQCTSDGMLGASSGEAVVAAVHWPSLPPSCVVLDTVYAPLETPFLAMARARALRADNGLGMLAQQGALAFSLWLGLPPPRDIMLAALQSFIG
jgi:shikimate dehydrogenase